VWNYLEPSKQAPCIVGLVSVQSCDVKCPLGRSRWSRMKTRSHLACVAPCFDILDHGHRLNCAASSLSTTFYGIMKHRNNVRKGIKFDQ